jgi:tripartite-type tricarboxylate transporter receptor subunit TctC
MEILRRQFLHLAARAVALLVICAIAIALTGQSAWSQTTRTIKNVAPAAPGGVADTVARLLGEQIGRSQGQTILIENRTGAGGVIAAEAVSRAAPDGSTVLMMGSDTFIPPHLRKLNFDLLSSFEPICYLVSAPTVIAVHAASPYRTIADLLDAARAKPGDLTLASFGPATAFQIAFEKLKRVADVNMTFLPYPGVAPAINALLGEHVTSVFASYSTASEQLNAGKLRALAVASRTRIERLPDVPTVAESNHTFDAEERGFLDTIRALDAAGISHVGGGRDLSEARTPVIVERNGIKIGFIGYTQFTNFGESAIAASGRPGVAPMDPFLIKEDIRRLRPQVDYVLVAIHWATNRKYEINPDNRKLAHDLIDAGADLILGHHPPHPKGIEVYHGKAILYAPSNVLRGHTDPDSDDGYLVRFTLGKTMEKIEVLPIAGKGQPEGHTGSYDATLFQPFLMQGASAHELLEGVRSRSAALDTPMQIDGDIGVITIPAAAK